ncbi:MAG: DivIVA domain-containing protein [Coriobacteriia bacterium]|nr:DivIVA domain-containing protein [Coriobacteriia bacterium]MCL2749731.1 DivIVA domain-containing protein [Coriobacteriia bacterium]
MAITKQDIDNVSLKIVQEGYDPEEVDLLLERIAEEVDSFNRALLEAASRVEAAETRARAAEQQASQSAHMAQSSQSSQQMLASERQIAQALIAAQKSADELHEAAKLESEYSCREAEKRARDIVRDALSEKQHIIDEVDRLRESTETFRSEYMAVLSRFTSEAQKVMPKLEDYKPNVEAEKRATAEAMKVIKEADASFEAPAPKVAASESAQVGEEFREGSAQSTNYLVTSAPNQSSQSVFELDDDLDIDIEEID